MIYPQFLKKGDTIGICAPSAGVGRDLDEYLESIKVLKKQGYKIKETKSVRTNSKRSASAVQRAKEFYDLTSDKNVDMIMFAIGGDYMLEIMPFVEYDQLVKNPKWIMGMSDPTNILFDVTCGYDIATLYGFNGKNYSLKNEKCQNDNLQIIQGNLIKQKSYDKYQSTKDRWNGIDEYNNDVKWISKKPIDVKGRIIGGCFDVILNHLGTFLDNTKTFVVRYAQNGIIWYFDIYSKTPLDVYLGLLQLKYAGLFNKCKCVLIGRVAIENIEDKNFDYHKAVDKALGNIPHIMEMDIGHTHPCMTIINGAIAHVKCKNGKGEISFELK